MSFEEGSELGARDSETGAGDGWHSHPSACFPARGASNPRTSLPAAVSCNDVALTWVRHVDHPCCRRGSPSGSSGCAPKRKGARGLVESDRSPPAEVVQGTTKCMSHPSRDSALARNWRIPARRATRETSDALEMPHPPMLTDRVACYQATPGAVDFRSSSHLSRRKSVCI